MRPLRPLAAALLLALLAPSRDAQNVVYVLADDLGWGELGSYGQTKIQTPHLDRLAAEGMRMTRHYSGSPVCAPSRCVLLTGLHTGHAVVRDNWENGGWGPDEPEGQLPLPPESVTLAELLKERGYATAAIGKWGLGGPDTTGHPNRQGFDHFFGYLCQRKAHNYFPSHLWRNEQRVELNDYFRAHQRLEEPLATPADYAAAYQAEHYAPDLMIDEALRFVRENAERPFFLYYASPIPHVALQVHDDDLEAYPAEWDDDPYLGTKGYLPHPSPRRAYAAMVSHLDGEVGLLLDLLDELGLRDDTIVVFSSDNGPTFNGGSDSAFFESTAGLRGLKCSVYEGGVRVPCIVRWPSRIAAGATTAHVSGFQDVLPTILELVGAALPEHQLDGISFAPTLLGLGGQRVHDHLYWEYAGRQALLRDPWKAVRPRVGKGDLALELYHLGDDPAESRDVAGLYPGVVEELEGVLAAARTPSTDFPVPALDDPSATPGADGRE